MSYPSGKETDVGPQQPRGGAHSQQGVYIYRHEQPAAYSQAAEYPQVMAAVNKPPPISYLVWSIISLLFFCLPIGIAALIFSMNASTAYTAGRHAEARYKSFLARVLNITATALGLVIWIVVGVWVVVRTTTYDATVG